ncbi:MAG TPA: antibiotic biosynthesis monooxygenase family protein [Alphaproteobacteria bacterium]
MILEIAQIAVKPGSEAEFEAGVKKAVPIFQRAKGCKGVELQRSIEKPSRYRLFVRWQTVENHTVDFRGSQDFQAWRALVAQCFDGAPEVEHTNLVLKGF